MITFANLGGVGATFLVTSAATAGGPWTYTVEAGKELPADLALPAGGPYDFTVHGPNGFLRRFTGGAGGSEVSARHDGQSGDLRPMPVA
jgi:phospholipase C